MKKTLLLILAVLVALVWLDISLLRLTGSVVYTSDIDMANEGFWKERRVAEADVSNPVIPAQIPGPFDSWAGSEPKEITIEAPSRRLTSVEIFFLDSHELSPPKLEIRAGGELVNEVQTKPGAGTSSRRWKRFGKSSTIKFLVPGNHFSGAGEGRKITIKSVSGSWAAIDRIEVETLPQAWQRQAAIGGSFLLILLTVVLATTGGHLAAGWRRFRSRKENTFYAIMVASTLLIFGVVSYYAYGYTLILLNYYLTPNYVMGHVISHPNQDFYVDDPVIGYRVNPGAYKLTIVEDMNGGKYSEEDGWNFRATIGEDGYRITSPAQADFEGKPGLWIFGCSFTWGWALNDDQTFPWRLQEMYPDYSVRNMAVNAYGNVQALIQLTEELKKDAKPEVAVFMYNPFHLVRNVAEPRWLSGFRETKDGALPLRHPKAYMDEKEKLGLEIIPLAPRDEPGLDRTIMVKVTQLIFKEILRICKENGIKPILAFQTGGADDPVVAYSREIGFTIADLFVNVPADKKYTFYPWDLHPNDKAHKIYANRLTEVLQEVVLH